MPIFYSNYLSRSRTLHYSWNIYQSNWFILPTFKLHKVSLKLLTSNQEKRGLKWIQKNSKVSHLLLRLDLTPKTQKVKKGIQYVTFWSEPTNLKRSFSGLGVLQSCVCYQDPRPLLFPQLPTISINLDSFLAKDPPRLQIFPFLEQIRKVEMRFEISQVCIIILIWKIYQEYQHLQENKQKSLQ